MKENQYERLLKRKKERTRFSISYAIVMIVIFLGFFFLGIYLLSHSTISAIFITFLSFVFPLSIFLFSMYFLDKKKGFLIGSRIFIKISKAGGKNSIIEVKNTSKTVLENKVKEFLEIYKGKMIIEEKIIPEIKTIGSQYFLVFCKPIEFSTFAFWVNYLSFYDDNQNNYIIGWYPAEEINTRRQWMANKDVMVFCLNDKEFDKNYVFGLIDDDVFFKKSLNVGGVDDNIPYYSYIPLESQSNTIEYRMIPNIKL